MYLTFGIIFFILLFFFFCNFWRKKSIIKKLCCMSSDEKEILLSSLTIPFGFHYCDFQQVFSSTVDAWQKEFGYCTIFDKAALGFHIVFDYYPIYFVYQGKTWLIEIWKGQYGITTGAEIGIYHADRILHKHELDKACFQAASQEEMLYISYDFYDISSSSKNQQFYQEELLARMSKRHWWLTSFCMGRFSNPAYLSMHITINFPDCTMRDAFLQGLNDSGYNTHAVSIACNRVAFWFHQAPHASKPSWFRRLRIRFAQWMNCFWCRVYLWITKPFCNTIDKLLYLYFYLPFAFRRILLPRKFKSKRASYKCVKRARSKEPQ